MSQSATPNTMTPTVYVGVITRGSLRVEFVTSLLALVSAEQTLVAQGVRQPLVRRFHLEPYGPYLDQGRNRVVEQFMQSGEDYLLFIDDDIAFNPADVYTLVDTAHANGHLLSSGVYCSTWEGIGVGPVVYRYGYDDAQQVVTFQCDTELPRDGGVYERDGAGCGFMLIHRDLVTKIRAKYPPPLPTPFSEDVIGGVHCGEDFTLCHRARAVTGKGVFINTTVELSHIKLTAVRRDGLRPQPTHPGITVFATPLPAPSATEATPCPATPSVTSAPKRRRSSASATPAPRRSAASGAATSTSSSPAKKRSSRGRR